MDFKSDKSHSNSASLDRIDSTKGYIKGNLQIISFRANTVKNNLTLDEMKMIVSNWERLETQKDSGIKSD